MVKHFTSGSTVACSARDPRSNHAADKSLGVFTKNHCNTQLWEQAAHTAVPRLTQPSTLRGTVNELSTNTNGDG